MEVFFLIIKLMRIKTIFYILFSLLCIQNLSAQKAKKINIKGTVLGVDKEPISNAMVLIDGEKTNSTTDLKGQYSVKAKGDAAVIMIVTFGNGTFEDSIKGRTQIDFNFSTISVGTANDSEISEGDEAVNSGYQVSKRKYTTTEISKVDGTDQKFRSYSTIYDMIQREVSGVRVTGETIVVGESKNLWGYIYPLLLVDGVEVPSIRDIKPSAVKSIEVLKGTSAAMYGTRGYGGVIMITTKKGNE
jgi:TonB-dependent SusC/RagA subfamily outer membrane receptor